jgi:hypothetical protein
MDGRNAKELMAVKILYYLHLITQSIDICLNLEIGLNKGLNV